MKLRARRLYPLSDLAGNASQKEILLTMIFLAWPTILEQFLETLVQYVDTAMVGRVSAQASAVVGLSTSLNWLVNSPIFAVGIGFLTLIATGLGEGDGKTVKRAVNQAILLVVALGLIEGIITLCLSPFIPAWMHAEVGIRREASLYFAIICFPMLFRAAIIILGSVLRACGDTRTPLKINLMVNGINILLNFFMIYPARTFTVFGHAFNLWGLGLGPIGAGLGTAISFTIGGLLMWRAVRQNALLYSSLKDVRLEAEVMAKGLRLSLPIALNKTVNSLGYVVFSGLVSGLGTQVFAAHTIAIVAESIFYVPGYGMQAATSTMIAYTVGKRNWRLYHKTFWSNLVMIVIIMLPLSVMLFVSAHTIMQYFTSDGEVVALGTKVLRMIAFSEPLFGASIVLEGIYNGLGRTHYPFIVETSSMWGVRILGVAFLVMSGTASLLGVWGLMIADNMLKTVWFGIGLFSPRGRQNTLKVMTPTE